jgi:hypothetical protein
VEALKRKDRKRRSPKKFPYFRALMFNIIYSETYNVKEETYKKFLRDVIVQDDVCDIGIGSEGELVLGISLRSTFLAKRDC